MACVGHWILAQGWAVLPLCWTDDSGRCACGRDHAPKNAGKIPLTSHGSKDASTDPDTIDTWHRKWPRANWGVLCHDLTVIDIDDPLLAGRFKADTCWLTQHFIVATPRRGGVHIYLRTPGQQGQSTKLKDTSGRVVGDIKRTGYVVAPGSKWADRAYQRLTDNEPVLVDDVGRWIQDNLGLAEVTGKRSRRAAIPPAPIDTSGVDVDAALKWALAALPPVRATNLHALLSSDPEGGAGLPSPSERDFHVVLYLLEAGLTDPEVAAVWRASPCGQRDKVQNRPDYVVLTVGKAREAASLGAVTSALPLGDEPEGADDQGVSLTKLAVETAGMHTKNSFLEVVLRQYLRPDLIDLLHRAHREALEGRGELLRRVNKALDTLDKRDMPWDGPFLISAQPGLGKTHTVVSEAEQDHLWKQWPVLHLGPSHKSFENVGRNKARWGLWRGHDDGRDDSGRQARPPCRAWKLANTGYITDWQDCACQAQRYGPADRPTFAPVEYALADSPEGPPLRASALDFQLWVLDDIGLDRFVRNLPVSRRDVQAMEQHPSRSVKTLAKALGKVMDEHAGANNRKGIRDAVHWSGQDFYQRLSEALQEVGVDHEKWSRALLDELDSAPSWVSRPWSDPHDYVPPNFALALLFDSLLTLVARAEGRERNPRVHLVWERPKESGQWGSRLHIRARKYLPRAAWGRTVVLDATADVDLWNHVLGTPVYKFPNMSLPLPFPPKMRIVQLHRGNLGKGTAEHFEEDGKVVLNPRYRDLLKAEMRDRREHGQAAKVGLITFQELVPDCMMALTEVGYNSDDIVTGYYYNLRGANVFTKCDVLVLVGYPFPNPQGLYEEACALFNDHEQPISREVQDFTLDMRLKNGHTLTILKPLYGYKDWRLQALLLQKSQAELYQAVHRARPFAPNNSVKEVLVFTDVPAKDIPVDTFLGSAGRVFDTLVALLKERDMVALPALVEAVLNQHGHAPWGADPQKAAEALSKWVRGQKDKPGNHEWMAQATGTVFEPQDRGRPTSKSNPYVFRRKPIR
jgi:hypothetical protein